MANEALFIVGFAGERDARDAASKVVDGRAAARARILGPLWTYARYGDGAPTDTQEWLVLFETTNERREEIVALVGDRIARTGDVFSVDLRLLAGPGYSNWIYRALAQA